MVHKHLDRRALAAPLGPYCRHDVARLYLQVYGPELEARVGLPHVPERDHGMFGHVDPPRWTLVSSDCSVSSMMSRSSSSLRPARRPARMPSLKATAAGSRRWALISSSVISATTEPTPCLVRINPSRSRSS